MTTQPEQILENNLVAQLVKLGYKNVVINDETDLLANLKSQLEVQNKTELSDNDFKQILNFINKGNVLNELRYYVTVYPTPTKKANILPLN